MTWVCSRYNVLIANVKPWSHDWLIASGTYPGVCSMKRLGVFLLALDGMLVHHRSLLRNLLGFPNNLQVPIYTPGWREGGTARCKSLVQENNRAILTSLY